MRTNIKITDDHLIIEMTESTQPVLDVVSVEKKNTVTIDLNSIADMQITSEIQDQGLTVETGLGFQFTNGKSFWVQTAQHRR